MSKLLAWDLLKTVAISTLVITITLCLSNQHEQVGLLLVWKIYIPLLPLVFFFIPSVWRNICPLAAINQIPRLFGLSKHYQLPNFLFNSAPFIGGSILVTGILSRKYGLDSSGVTVALLGLFTMLAALVGGLLFKGKSGWCGTFCPLASLQWLYGQSPLTSINNHHCKPCLSCVQHCIDNDKGLTVVNELYQGSQFRVNARLLFISIFPGVILAFFLGPEQVTTSNQTLLLVYFIVFPVFSLIVFVLLWKIALIRLGMLTGLFGLAVLMIFYIFNGSHILDGVNQLTKIELPHALSYAPNFIIGFYSITWIKKVYKQEKDYLSARNKVNIKNRISKNNLINVVELGSNDDIVKVTIVSRKQTVTMAKGRILLDALEEGNVGVQGNCRVGGCGADLVTIIAGKDNVSPVSTTEQITLSSLTKLSTARLACCVKVFDDISIELGVAESLPKNAESLDCKQLSKYQQGMHIVVIGSGIAGLSAVKSLRDLSDNCNITLIGGEPYLPYNRMNITQLITGKMGLIGFQLQSEQWFLKNKVDMWLNTQVISISPEKKQVTLALGKQFSYDKLILAQGSRVNPPTFINNQLQGIHSLRTADDAIAIRSDIQQRNCKVAVVVGTGPLGLEIADSLHSMGIKVIILERSNQLMKHHLDKTAAIVLALQLRKRRLNLLFNSKLEECIGKDNIKAVKLDNGRQLKCDLLILATGNQPNIELAEAANLKTSKGVVVNRQLQTSNPDIYAIGDLAELENSSRVDGLWSVAEKQGSLAANNILGKIENYQPAEKILQLKMTEIDLLVVGERIKEGGQSIVLLNNKNYQYRKLIISEGRIVGAILIGYPELKPLVLAAINQKLNVSPILAGLRKGHWIASFDSLLPSNDFKIPYTG